MKKYFILIALASLAAFVSCNKDEKKNDEGRKEFTISASIAATKTTASAQGLVWNAGDAIIVSCDGEAYNFTTEQSGANADFTTADGLTQKMVGINPLTAFYGCTQFGSFTIPQNQTISGEESQTRLPMYAYTTQAPSKNEVAMVFTPAASMLEVSLTPVDVTINKVELIPVDETAVSGTVAGPGTVNPVTGKVSFTGNLKSVSANFQGGASAKNGLVFRMPVGWFSVTGGMKLVLTYNENSTYEELLWTENAFQSYEGSGDAKSYKYLIAAVEMVIGARDFYVAPNGKATSKGIRPEDPATLDYALSSADEGSVIHLAEGTYTPSRILSGEESGDARHKTFEIARGLTLVGEGSDKTVLFADSTYHAVCVTALPEAKVVLKSLAIKGGKNTDAPEAGSVTSSVNEAEYFDNYGAGLYAVGSDIELENVLISGNVGVSGVGAYLNGAKASLKNVEVSGNKSTGNGCGFWASASEITMEGCSVSNNIGGGIAAGLYVYAAAETVSKATVTDCVFTGNVASSNCSAVYVRGADATANVSASFTNCTIEKNQGTMGGGFGTIHATVLFDGCQIVENTGTGNGANYIQNGSKVTFNNSIVRDNKAALGGGLYVYNTDTEITLNVFNSEISGNKTMKLDNGEYVISAGRGGGIYARCNSTTGMKVNIANSTFFGNVAGHFGSAIAFYAANNKAIVANIYSSTFTGNDCTSTTANRGGALGAETAAITVNLHNCIVSGNTWATTPTGADVYVANAGSKVNIYKSVKGAEVYDDAGAAIGTAPAFDPANMLSKKAQDGKTTVFSLVGNDNPAKTYGYDVAGLKALNPTIDGAILEKDQWGNARTASVMGAYVE